MGDPRDLVEALSQRHGTDVRLQIAQIVQIVQIVQDVRVRHCGGRRLLKIQLSLMREERREISIAPRQILTGECG
jgi:hypothetical protein